MSKAKAASEYRGARRNAKRSKIWLQCKTSRLLSGKRRSECDRDRDLKIHSEEKNETKLLNT